MDFDLISEEEYENLPSDPFKKFAALEQICRRNMMKVISNETSEDFDSLIRTQYMTIIATAAEELGVEGIRYIDIYDNISSNLDEFMRITSGVIARIRLRGLSGKDGLSVKLANRTKGIIEAELAKVSDAVLNSDLPEAKKNKLLEKIDQFRTELHKERLAYGKAMAYLAVIATVTYSTTGFLADAPTAITTILQVIGQDKEAEDAEVKRLGNDRPPLLTDQTRDPSVKTSRYPKDDDLDDDIPF